jgi:hypothetical protein
VVAVVVAVARGCPVTPTRYTDPRGNGWTLRLHGTDAAYRVDLDGGHVWAVCSDLPRLLRAMDLTPRKGRAKKRKDSK